MIFVNKEDGSYVIKRRDSKQFSQVIDLYKNIFHDSDSFIRVIMEKVKAVSIDVEKGIVVAIALYREKRIFENGKIKKVPFIFGVATHREYRNQRRAHKVMNGILNYLTNKGYDRALLAPANKNLYNFYEDFGFYKSCFFEYKQAEIAKKYFLIRATLQDYKIMTTLFNRNSKKMDSSQYRTNDDMKLKLKEIEADGGRAMLAVSNNTVVGYYLEDEEIIETIGIDWNIKTKGKTIIIPSKKYVETDECPGIVTKCLENKIQNRKTCFYDMW